MDVHNPIECLHSALQPVDRWVGAPMAHLAARMRPLEAAPRRAPVQICAAWTMLRQAGRALTRLGASGPALVSSLPIAAARLAHPSLPCLTQCTLLTAALQAQCGAGGAPLQVSSHIAANPPSALDPNPNPRRGGPAAGLQVPIAQPAGIGASATARRCRRRRLPEAALTQARSPAHPCSSGAARYAAAGNEVIGIDLGEQGSRCTQPHMRVCALSSQAFLAGGRRQP